MPQGSLHSHQNVIQSRSVTRAPQTRFLRQGSFVWSSSTTISILFSLNVWGESRCYLSLQWGWSFILGTFSGYIRECQLDGPIPCFEESSSGIDLHLRLLHTMGWGPLQWANSSDIFPSALGTTVWLSHLHHKNLG